jgi:mono/diheme cytochrome c family protein
MTGLRCASAAVLAALFLAPAALAQDRSASPAAGQRLAAANCGRCHAVDRRDQSPNPRAPRFRDLGAGFPFDGLRDALNQHMIVGHPEMPVMDLKPTEIDDLVAYLRSLQRTGRTAKPKSRDS